MIEIKNGDFEFKENEVYTETQVKYIQNEDSYSEGVQELVITEEDAGGGKFLVIKTDRWAFDNLDDLIKLFTNFQTKSNG